MSREFIVRIRRTDYPKIDPVHIRAATRQAAEDFVRLMFGARLVEIVRRAPKRGAK